MIFSMTGYATHTAAVGKALLTIDLRSVNQRYLEIGFRLPDELRAQEPLIREAIVQRLSRGKVECRISQTPLPEAALDIGLNEDILESLARWQQGIRKRFPDAPPLSVAEILGWSGVLAMPGGGQADMSQALPADAAKARNSSGTYPIASSGPKGWLTRPPHCCQAYSLPTRKSLPRG
jgi:uncharacterized protein (TIGR00255 family)